MNNQVNKHNEIAPALLSPAIATSTACDGHLWGTHLHTRECFISAKLMTATRRAGGDRVQESATQHPTACAIEIEGLVAGQRAAQIVARVASSIAPGVLIRTHVSRDPRGARTIQVGGMPLLTLRSVLSLSYQEGIQLTA